MLNLKRFTRSIDEMMTYMEALPAERLLRVRELYRHLLVWQEHPPIAMRFLAGIFIPPHQRRMLYTQALGRSQNVFIGSRGTSKTSTIDVVGATHNSMFRTHRQRITLSGSSGFRGGQLLYNDLEQLATGNWVDQKRGMEFVRASMSKDSLIHRAQNYWAIPWTTGSSMMTVPTNDPEKLRGIRGTDLDVDEANFADWELIEKVAESFLNVLKDFATGGENAPDNIVTFTTTVDYAWRDFQKTVRAAREGLRREYEWVRAAARGDVETCEALERQGLGTYSHTCFDYTDTFALREITTRDGRVIEFTWPDKNRNWRKDPGFPYSVRDGDTGVMRLEPEPCEVISTYPINRKTFEPKILSAATSTPVYLAEQRNVVDSSAGDVYPHHVVDGSVHKSGRTMLPFETCPPEWQKKYRRTERGYVPDVMWSCADPCVLGVDYAPGSRDFSAFVVIRLGPMATGEFNPLTGCGHTPWSNVIWAEQHRNASGRNVAEKIFAMAERYNLQFFDEPHEVDTWKLARAVGIDGRGGGNAVRDELTFINDESVALPKYRMYDPLDPDERVKAYRHDPHAKPMLDVIMPTGKLNDTLVEFTLGQLTQRALYIAADVPPHDRTLDKKLDVGYDGCRVLEHQLRALQQAPTASGYRTFYMKGDVELESNKKDMWAAFIYAAKQARAHLHRFRLIDDHMPALGAAKVVMGGKKIQRHAFGAKPL